ncbi:MAG TPA: carbamate kinase [Cyanothece sp. UBA12306]|nr:carbamate kinase [Cyanothece sp. UBA12306]
MLVMIALGGNALIRRGQPPEVEIQRENIKQAAQAIAKVARDHQVVVTHGNGPQVGLLAMQSETYQGLKPYPLDILDAQTEGAIGYLIEQELDNQGLEPPIVTLLTQIEVDPDDLAFSKPTKPIGAVYSKIEAQRLAQERGWTIAADGQGYRRVVPSPEPKRILELSTIELLVKVGALVICGGGGGIPVIITPSGRICGVEAVIDKDLATALLATKLQADALLLLTDVDGVYTNWGTPTAKLLSMTTPSELSNYSFAPGSMQPKVEAACRFVKATGAMAGIGKLEDAVEILRGDRGTMVK